MGDAYALGVGNIRVQSSLGQQLRAQLEVTGVEAQDVDLGCFRASVESAEGVFLSPVDLKLSTQGNVKYLNLFARKNISEPAVRVVLNISCDLQLHREYLILLDPPDISASIPNQIAAMNEVAQAPANTLPQRVDLPAQISKKIVVKNKSEIVAVNADQSTNSKRLKSTKKMIDMPRTKDALKLSDDADVVPQGLKLESTLSQESDHKNGDRSAELRLAQAQFAAMLRGENAPSSSAAVPVAPDQKNRSTTQETIQLKRQLLQGRTALEDLREASVPKEWFYVLIALILAALGLAGLLVAYIRRIHKKTSSTWWEQKEARPVVETKPNIEELVNSVQASYISSTTVARELPDSGQNSSSAPQSTIAKTKSKTESQQALGNIDAPSIFGKNYTPSLEDTNSSTFNFFSSRATSVKVEEISDVTQEAEFWMSVNDPERAIEILEPQAELDQPDSPVPWLYLLDLYRVVGNKEKYDPLRDRFVVFFNANVPEFEVDPATLPSRHLDDFEHLSKNICSMWNSNEILPFLESLLIDDRDGKRMGFELPVYRDILLLISIANELERQKTSGGGARVWENASTTPVATNAPVMLEEDSNVINFETIDFQNKPDLA